jgi:hypothetical protein
MIRMLQVLCGPRRHAILGVLYDDQAISPEDTRQGLEILIEERVALGSINRRCEICDKPVIQFLYEDGISGEQDWDKAQVEAKRLEVEQMLARRVAMAARRAGKN